MSKNGLLAASAKGLLGLSVQAGEPGTPLCCEPVGAGAACRTWAGDACIATAAAAAAAPLVVLAAPMGWYGAPEPVLPRLPALPPADTGKKLARLVSDDLRLCILFCVDKGSGWG